MIVDDRFNVAFELYIVLLFLNPAQRETPEH
jgi:hypothetical protein